MKTTDKTMTRKFIALLGHKEGEEPTIIEGWDEMDILEKIKVNPTYAPQALSPASYRTYEALIA